MTLHEMMEKLKAPFPAGMEKYRVGSVTKDKKKTKPLSYIDARCVYDRLDEVVGPDNWSTKLVPLAAAGSFICELTILGVTKSDVGMAGENEGEKSKSGSSDAIKRAAVQFGIGRYLYDIDLPWVELNEYGQLPNGWKPPTSPVKTPKPKTPVVVAESPVKPPNEAAKPLSLKEQVKVEVARTGITPTEGVKFLKATFEKETSASLTEKEDKEFLAYLTTLPAKVAK